MASASQNQNQNQNQQQQQQQQILKCPRCDSSNTKFCYYNNYSLSQPRHFCKACKRYWTRGGTLRNVPVGGGCRKNKRTKRTTTTTTSSSSVVTVGHHHPNPSSNPNLDHMIPSSATPTDNNFNPLYGLSEQHNSKYPRFDTDVTKYNRLHPNHMSSFGLVFPSSDPVANHAHDSISLVSSYPSMIDSTCTSNPMMASFLASNLQQQPRFLGFAPYGDEGGSAVNDVQMAAGTNNNFDGQIHNDQIKGVESSDPTFLWNTSGGDGGEWFDPTSNICSSVRSLI